MAWGTRRVCQGFWRAGLAILALPGGRGVAQPPVSPPIPPKPIATLEEALDCAAWNTGERGPIISVAPEAVKPFQPEPTGINIFVPQTPPAPMFAPEAGGHRLPLNVVASYFNRRVVRLGSLVAVAPATMAVFNTRLGPPDPLRGLTQSRRLALLESTLSPAQWRLLGSAAGLGLGDITGKQRPLFLGVLPDPLRLLRFTVSPTSGPTLVPDPKDGSLSPALSEAQRRGVRLRVIRRVSLNLTDLRNDPIYDGDIEMPTPPPVGPITSLGFSDDIEDGDGIQFGQRLVFETPSRLKTSQLDFDALAFSRYLSLAGVKTVGDAIKRLRDETGVELYADGRLAPLHLYLSRDSVPVRAGDLLKALCWGVSGAFRRVGPDASGKTAFVLTDDVEGLGVRRARLDRWWAAGRALAFQLEERVNTGIRAQKPLQYLGFDAADPLALSPEAMKHVAAQWTTWRFREATPLPVALLTTEQQAAVTATRKRRAEAKDDRAPVVAPDRVVAQVEPCLNLIIPGVGEISTAGGGVRSLSRFLPAPEKTGYEDGNTAALGLPFAAPATMKSGITLLTLPPATDADTHDLFALAQEKGIKQVWFATGDDGKAVTALQHLISAANPYGIGVGAVARLMSVAQSPAAAPPDAPPTDVNILGETGAVWAAAQKQIDNLRDAPEKPQAPARNFLLPPEAHTLPFLHRRLAPIASLPGLAALVLTDAAAPGYHSPRSDSLAFSLASGDFGYTLANRLRLLREAGFDPLDLWQSTTLGGGEETLPFIEKADRDSQRNLPGSAARAGRDGWYALRHGQQAGLLADLYRSLRTEYPALPLYLHSLGETNKELIIYKPVVVRWEKADGLPRLPLDKNGVRIDSQAFGHTLSRQVFAFATITPDAMYHMSSDFPNATPPDTPQRFAQEIRFYFETGGRPAPGAWDGLVLDLRQISLQVALPLLQKGLSPAKATPVTKESTK